MSTEDRSARIGRIGMMFFLATEAMLFAGLIAAYWVLRNQIGVWPPAGQPRLPVLVTGVNTLVLTGGGIAMFLGRRALVKGCQLCLIGWIGIAVGCGFFFLGVQGYEWVRLLGFGMKTAGNIYGGLFYVIVGAHGLHVLAALVALLVVFFRAVEKRYSPSSHSGFTMGLMFWSFVVFLWPILYAIVYLA